MGIPEKSKTAHNSGKQDRVLRESMQAKSIGETDSDKKDAQMASVR